MSHSSSASSGKEKSLRESVPSYLSMITSMRRRYPNLGDLDETLKHQTGCFKNDYEKGRAAVIEFKNGDVEVLHFAGPEDLQDYLSLAPTDCTRRLYLLEGLPAKYIDIFGSHFQMDPNLFARQLHAGFWDLAKNVGNSSLLPSHPTSKTSFCLRYMELRDFGGAIREYEMRCANQPRRISVSRFRGKFDGVGMVRRLTSFWYRNNGANGWDALILLDPQVGETFYVGNGSQRKRCLIPNVPYRGGYVDFSPAIMTMTGTTAVGPPRTSAFDDLCFYWTQPELTRHLDLTSPTTAAIYLKRYVAAQWMVLCQFNHDSLIKHEFLLHRYEKLVHLSPTTLEQEWSDVECLNGRWNNFVEQTESSISQFSSSGTLGDYPGQEYNDIVKEDFDHVLRQLLDMKKRIERLVSSMTGLLNIIEAKRMKGLTAMGMLFITLAFTSGIFSMTGDFAPGGPSFWVYFAVALPLVLIVFVVVFASSSGSMIVKGWLFKMRLLDHEAVEVFPQPFLIGQVAQV